MRKQVISFGEAPSGWTIVNGQGTNNISVWTGSTGGAVPE